MKRLTPTYLALAAVFWAFVPSAAATTVLALSDAELARRSSVIALATVLESKTVWNAKSKSAFTVVKIQVNRPVVGAEMSEILAIQLPGGKLGGGLVQRVDGAPELEVGDVFLGFFHRHGAVLKPTGMALGVMPVVGSSGDYRVTQVLGNLSFVAGPGGSTSVVNVHNQPLSAVLAHFDSLVAPAKTGLPGAPGVVR